MSRVRTFRFSVPELPDDLWRVRDLDGKLWSRTSRDDWHWDGADTDMGDLSWAELLTMCGPMTEVTS